VRLGRLLAGEQLQRLIEVAEKAAVVEIAVTVFEVALQEERVVAFLDVIQPRRRPLMLTTA
jgi:hypothetical protein